MLKTTLLKYILLFIFTGHNDLIQATPVIIEGKVIAETNGWPVSEAHVFIVDGEEEALTNNKGEFKIRSWQKTPFKLTVEKHDRYEKESIVVTDPSQQQVIRLKNKR